MIKQAGFTLVEILVSLSLVGLIATGASSAVFSLLRVSSQIGETLPALNSLPIAGQWISRDAQLANRTSLVSGAPPINLASTPVDFYRTDYYLNPPISHTTTYTLSSGELRRNLDSQATTVARNISAVTFSRNGRTVTVVISASGQEKTYQVFLRPN